MLNYSYSNIKKGIHCAKNFSTKVLFLVMLLVLTLAPLKVQAQQYPVKLIPVVLAPYSLKLADYATSTENKLQLQVLMTDLMEPQHQVGLRFSLESGLNSVPFAQSNDFVVGMSPFMLYPGTNITLTNVDLRALFELQNLSGISGLQYSQALPEGIYHYCFQAYDYYTRNILSAKTCATAYLIQYDPPILNLPQNAEKIQALMPYGSGGGVVFQWMPQQIAPNTKYIFTLKEIWDLGQNPISGYLSSRVLWQEETHAPSLYYGIDKPQLIPGKRYGWQVQAKSGNPVFGSNPTEDNGVYKNNGLSEIYYFDYVENCAVPTLLMAKNVGRGRVEISWSLNRQPSGLYVVQYRKKNSNSEWMTQQSYQSPAILTGLADLTEYEYRVGSVCGNLSNYNNTYEFTSGNSAGNTYSYSSIQYFTTNANDASNNYQCGVMPSIDITNKNPLQSLLGVNEVFTAGDFPVTVLSAQGSNGIYTGTGYIQVPYLGDAKIKVSFTNIKLNSDKKLIEGIIETTYDPAETAVAYTSAGLGETFGDSGVKEVHISFPINNISYSATPPPGVITIHGGDGNSSGNGSQTEYPSGTDYTFTDPDGKIWTVDENGNITGPQQTAEGGVSTSSNTEGVSGMGGHATINQYTAKGIKIEWEENILGKYAYDTHEKTKLPDDQYPSVKDADNQTVYIPYKATVNKETELFNAIVHITDPALKDAKIVFKTLSVGKTIEATEKTKTDTRREYELKLKGTFDYAEEEVIAVLMPQDSTAKQKIISSFRLVHLGKKVAKVHLVPLDGASEGKLSTIENTIGAIYKKIGVEYEFVKEDVLDISTLGIGSQIESGDSKLMNTYGSDQEKINHYYATHRGKDLKYVLFVTEKSSSKGQDGYMRLNGQFGYLFKNAPSKTAAHELGHGIFKLEHPSENLNISESSTPLLMDVTKGNDDIILSHLDWKQVNDPSFKLYGFQQQSSGEFSGGYAIAPDFRFVHTDNNLVTDYTEIHLSAGFLEGFTHNDKRYYWDGKEYITRSGEIYNDYESPMSDDAVIWLIYNHDHPRLGMKYVKTIYSKVKGILANKDISELANYIHKIDLIPEPENPKKGDIYSGYVRDSDNNKQSIYDEEPGGGGPSIAIKKQLDGLKETFGGSVEFYKNKKVYRQNKQGEVEEVDHPLTESQINEGQWEDEEKQKIRVTTDSTGVVQLVAFGIKANLPITNGKTADLRKVSKNILDKTNDFLKEYRVTNLNATAAQMGVDLNEGSQEFADGDKIALNNNASFMKIISEGSTAVITLFEQGKVEDKVYLDAKKKEVAFHAPGLVTGTTEAGTRAVTDITSIGVMVYDITVDKKARKEAYNGMVKLKDEIGKDPKKMVPIFIDVITESAMGSTPDELQKITNKETDQGERNHLSSRTVVTTVKTVISGSAFISKLPKITDDVVARVKKVKKILGNIDELFGKLDWDEATKALLRKDLNENHALKELFESAPQAERQISIAKSWKALDAKHPELKKSKEAVEKLADLSAHPKMVDLQINIDDLAQISGVSGKSYTEVLENITRVVDHLDAKNIQVEQFDRLIKSLGRDQHAFRDGANWTLEYIGKNTDEFAGKKLTFEDLNISEAGKRYVDITVNKGLDKTYYEFKSVKEVPPARFAEQFLKDLENAERLEDIKWIFDGKKHPTGTGGKSFRKAMEKGIDQLKLNTRLAEKYTEKQNINRLKKLLKDNIEKVFIQSEIH